MLAVVAPGQGSQVPGFLTPWLELPNFEDRMKWLGTVAGIDLIAHGTTSDEDTIRDTAVAQPLIVSAGMVSLLSLFPHPGEAFAKVAVGAGHSVGEITAAVVAGVFDAETGIKFVNERGQAMAKAAALEVTSMAAVLGGDQAEVEAKLASLELEPANYNGGGQIVALQGQGEAVARVVSPAILGIVELDEFGVLEEPVLHVLRVALLRQIG